MKFSAATVLLSAAGLAMADLPYKLDDRPRAVPIAARDESNMSILPIVPTGTGTGASCPGSTGDAIAARHEGRIPEGVYPPGTGYPHPTGTGPRHHYPHPKPTGVVVAGVLPPGHGPWGTGKYPLPTGSGGAAWPTGGFATVTIPAGSTGGNAPAY